MRGSFDPVHTSGSEHGCHNLEDLPSPTLSPEPKLLRKLTRLDGIAIIVGIIIGSGIFASVGKKNSVSLYAWISLPFPSYIITNTIPPSPYHYHYHHQDLPWNEAVVSELPFVLGF